MAANEPPRMATCFEVDMDDPDAAFVVAVHDVQGLAGRDSDKRRAIMAPSKSGAHFGRVKSPCAGNELDLTIVFTEPITLIW